MNANGILETKDEDEKAIESDFGENERKVSSTTATHDVKQNDTCTEEERKTVIGIKNKFQDEIHDKKPSPLNKLEPKDESKEGTECGNEDPRSESQSSAQREHKPKKKKKAKRAIKYCKAPQAPKRFKSAFIFFTMARHGEIRKKLESEGAADKVSYLLVLWQFHS